MTPTSLPPLHRRFPVLQSCPRVRYCSCPIGQRRNGLCTSDTVKLASLQASRPQPTLPSTAWATPRECFSRPPLALESRSSEASKPADNGRPAHSSRPHREAAQLVPRRFLLAFASRPQAFAIRKTAECYAQPNAKNSATREKPDGSASCHLLLRHLQRLLRTKSIPLLCKAPQRSLPTATNVLDDAPHSRFQAGQPRLA